VVGARSAVFAPLRNIGLIVLDEEHVDSYKQDNLIAPPYYHAREVAIFRGEQEHCKVVLGSATPSLESKARAMRGVYGYAEMKHRINEKALPYTRIIDLTDRSNISKKSNKISAPLLAKIEEKLAKHEQILLLINRRGYWTNIMCANCGHIFVCPSCGGNLTYHQEDEMLKCHHCGYVENFPKVCPECGSSPISCGPAMAPNGSSKSFRKSSLRPGFAGSIPMWARSAKTSRRSSMISTMGSTTSWSGPR
jgi:primosomal protein N' (replication factor Y)